MAQIKDVLPDMNSWWKEKFEVEFNERELHKKVQKYLPLRQIIAFTGLRRVGKTTLMLKRIYDTFRNIKIIISGSESLFIKNKSRAILAGRIFEFKVETLTFK